MLCRLRLIRPLVAAMLVTFIAPAAAQWPVGAAGPRPGGFGGPMMPIWPMMGPPSAIDVPGPVLEQALKLSARQRSRLHVIRRQLEESFRPPAFGPGVPPPTPGAMRAAMERGHRLHVQANKQLMAALNAEQRRALAALLRDIGDFSTVGLPMRATKELKLTATQRQAIGAIAARSRKREQAARKKAKSPWAAGPEVMAVWRKAQHEAMAARRKAHGEAMAALTHAQRATLGKMARQRFGPAIPGGRMGPMGAPGPGGPSPRGRGGLRIQRIAGAGTWFTRSVLS